MKQIDLRLQFPLLFFYLQHFLLFELVLLHGNTKGTLTISLLLFPESFYLVYSPLQLVFKFDVLVFVLIDRFKVLG
jgi:hypothetical protein